jgi:hypothetical protein
MPGEMYLHPDIASRQRPTPWLIPALQALTDLLQVLGHMRPCPVPEPRPVPPPLPSPDDYSALKALGEQQNREAAERLRPRQIPPPPPAPTQVFHHPVPPWVRKEWEHFVYWTSRSREFRVWADWTHADRFGHLAPDSVARDGAYEALLRELLERGAELAAAGNAQSPVVYVEELIEGFQAMGWAANPMRPGFRQSLATVSLR